MSWFKVDDGFSEHPKLEALEAEPEKYMAAVTVWVVMGADCVRRGSDGKVTLARLGKVLRCIDGMADKGATALVEIGLWERVGDDYRFAGWTTHTDRPRLARQEIFERDGWSCAYCGRGVSMVAGHVDHVRPRSRGGSDSKENLVTACVRCNLRKGARTPEEWRSAAQEDFAEQPGEMP